MIVRVPIARVLEMEPERQAAFLAAGTMTGEELEVPLEAYNAPTLAAPSQLFETRLAICRTCPAFEPAGWFGLGRCSRCGCIAQLKLRLSSQHCPDGLW